MIVDALVEGPTDEAVARKLVGFCQHRFGTTFGRHGQSYLQTKAFGFNVRAQYGNPILMLVDFMDTGLDCAARVPLAWLGAGRSPRLLLRVVVRELESWLLADSDGVAGWLGISSARIPSDPEALDDPKLTLVNLARRSRRRSPREAIVPSPGMSGVVGPGYTSAIEEFADQRWNVTAAMARSLSLRKCVARLRDLQ